MDELIETLEEIWRFYEFDKQALICFFRSDYKYFNKKAKRKEAEQIQADLSKKRESIEKIKQLIKATGTLSLGPETMCKGQCEGKGRVPIKDDDMEEPFRTLWLEAERKKPSEDGYHFVVCPDCNGTGKRVA